MSDPMTQREIEDVLMSIRRLVSQDDEAPGTARRESEGVRAGRLVLTPALRVVPPAGMPEAANGTPAEAPADSPADSPAAETPAGASGESAAEMPPPLPATGDDPVAALAPADPDSGPLSDAEAAPDATADALTVTQAGRADLQRTIAELEAAMSAAPGDWEPEQGDSLPASLPRGFVGEARHELPPGDAWSPGHSRPDARPDDATATMPFGLPPLPDAEAATADAPAGWPEDPAAGAGGQAVAPAAAPDHPEAAGPSRDAPQPALRGLDDTGERDGGPAGEAPAAEAAMTPEADVSETGIAEADVAGTDVAEADVAPEEPAASPLHTAATGLEQPTAATPADDVEQEDAGAPDAAHVDAADVSPSAETPQAGALGDSPPVAPATGADDRGSGFDSGFDDDFDDEVIAETVMDEAALRDLVAQIVREELQGALGERITRNVRKLVRAEIARAVASRSLD